MLHLLALTDSYRVPGFSFVLQQQQLVKESSARYVSTREIHFLLIFFDLLLDSSCLKSSLSFQKPTLSAIYAEGKQISQKKKNLATLNAMFISFCKILSGKKDFPCLPFNGLVFFFNLKMFCGSNMCVNLHGLL